jgi:hypothetical protein
VFCQINLDDWFVQLLEGEYRPAVARAIEMHVDNTCDSRISKEHSAKAQTSISPNSSQLLKQFNSAESAYFQSSKSTSVFFFEQNSRAVSPRPATSERPSSLRASLALPPFSIYNVIRTSAVRKR